MDESPFSRTYKLLVADDCENSRALVEIALEDPRLEISFAVDGDNAIAVATTLQPDLAILDVQMPGKSGLEVCSWIKNNAGNGFVPVILLTCRSEIMDKVNGIDQGADDYVTKPFALPELKARVRALLRIKELTDRLRETKNLLEEKEKQLVAVQVAGAAAHELGQPLTALLLNCELLSQLEGSNAALKETLTKMVEQANAMRDILAQFNMLTRFTTKSYINDVQILDLEGSRRPQ